MKTSKKLFDISLKALCDKIERDNFDLQEIRNELNKISKRGREIWSTHSPLISAVQVSLKSCQLTKISEIFN